MFKKQRKENEMNKKQQDVLKLLYDKLYTQRELAQITGYSLGSINNAIKILINKKYVSKDYKVTELGKKLIDENSPKSAIILAAGYGIRMVPINLEKPKGLIEVYGEPLIERIICQLKEIGLNKIYIVVGFMKEYYEYLIDKYNVELIVNNEYDVKNNLHSLKYAVNELENTYIVPCDIWCRENPFSKNELYSWYLVRNDIDSNSIVKVNRNEELVLSNENNCNKMIGITYLNKQTSKIVKKNVLEMCNNKKYDKEFWESALFNKNKMLAFAKVKNNQDVVEINKYEELREIDSNSKNLNNEAISIISNVLKVKNDEIINITVLKKGMTNRSFLFTCRDKRYIMRIPGEGTDKLISRYEEAEVYKKIKEKGIADNIIYINPNNGYKITEFIDNAKVCNPQNESDVRKCMMLLKKFHSMKLSVNHKFDIFEKIDFYESLWNGIPSIYKDYNKTKENIFELKSFIEKQNIKNVLTHIDAVPDNFLFFYDEKNNENIRLIDWEYAGMQDSHVDIAMFAIYSWYDKEQVDKLIDMYFEQRCTAKIRVKIYCYIAICGLLWSNWCEYKRNLGIEFGEYSLMQYRYAKEYYKIAKKEMEKLGGEQ